MPRFAERGGHVASKIPSMPDVSAGSAERKGVRRSLAGKADAFGGDAYIRAARGVVIECAPFANKGPGTIC